jgi:hypothetical protein
MIRYDKVDRAGLEALVQAHDPSWITKAGTRTAALMTAGAFVEASSIWGDIKAVFMRLQHFKCVFCERPLAGLVAGSAEHDLEHFRPKGSIKAWPKPKDVARFAYGFPTGPASDSGYYWLAYDLLNYAAACKPCNTARKSNYFPIGGARGGPHATVTALNAAEMPLLIYPITDLDDDPEDLITFDGVLAVPKHAAGRQHERARVTIDFFALNDREELLKDRFRAIRTAFLALEMANTNPDPARRAAANRSLDEAASDAGAQASCVRSYLRVATTDTARAWGTYLAAEAYLNGPAPP